MRLEALLLLSLPCAYGLDLLLGDPAWLYHPVRGIGKGIELAEKVLRAIFPTTRSGQRRAGMVLAILVPLASGLLVLALLLALYRLSLWAGLALDVLLCYQLLAVKSLRGESMAVYHELVRGDLSAARTAVGRIVGRDTGDLDQSGVARAAVETIAENTSDGVVAPLLYMSFGGAVAGMWYKAVNTLDSMVGYKNERYLHFGRTSAKLDDAANWLPARVSAMLMVAAAFLLGYDAKGGARVYRRDRFNHASPNSAHTEAVCAGALGLRLGGDASYFGQVHQKPTIGDPVRPVEAEDIRRANRLMTATSLLALLLCLLVRGGLLYLYFRKGAPL